MIDERAGSLTRPRGASALRTWKTELHKVRSVALRDCQEIERLAQLHIERRNANLIWTAGNDVPAIQLNGSGTVANVLKLQLSASSRRGLLGTGNVCRSPKPGEGNDCTKAETHKGLHFLISFLGRLAWTIRFRDGYRKDKRGKCGETEDEMVPSTRIRSRNQTVYILCPAGDSRCVAIDRYCDERIQERNTAQFSCGVCPELARDRSRVCKGRHQGRQGKE